MWATWEIDAQLPELTHVVDAGTATRAHPGGTTRHSTGATDPYHRHAANSMRRPAKHGSSSKACGDAGAASMLERSLVDDLVLAYVEWRQESTAVWQVYGWWARTGSEDAARAHAVYRTALDRKEAAATVYAKLIEAARQLLNPELNPASLAGGALCR